MKTALRRYAPGAFLALTGVCMALLLSALPAQPWGWAACGLALGAAAYGNARFFAETDRRLKTCFGVLGLLFVTATALGLRLDFHEETGWAALLLCVGTGLCLGPAAGEGFAALARLLRKGKTPIGLSSRQAFCLCLALLVVCWLPVALAFFPGITGYDIDNQFRQIQTGQYTTHHPLLHTLLIGGCMRLLGATAGYALYTGLQMAALAAAIAYAMSYLASIRCPKGLWMGLVVLFTLAPQHAVMAVSGTKDVLFAAALLMFVVSACCLYRDPEREKTVRPLARCLLWGALACLMRNGVAWAFGLAGLAGLLFARRLLGWRMPLCLALSAALSLCVNGGLKAALHTPDIGLTGEALSIPCQQLARVYALGEADEAEGEEILSRVPYAADYEPQLSDNAKSAVFFGHKPERLVSFFKLWGRVGLRHPSAYLDAFLYTTKGYWYVADDSFATIYDAQPNDARGVLMLRPAVGTGIQEKSLLPGLKALWKRLFEENGFRRFPALWQLLHPAVYSWLAAFAFTWAVWRKKNRFALLCGAALAETALKLLGPCCLIRYQYDLMLIAPVLLGVIASPAKEEIAP